MRPLRLSHLVHVSIADPPATFVAHVAKTVHVTVVLRLRLHLRPHPHHQASTTMLIMARIHVSLRTLVTGRRVQRRSKWMHTVTL